MRGFDYHARKILLLLTKPFVHERALQLAICRVGRHGDIGKVLRLKDVKLIDDAANAEYMARINENSRLL